MSDCNETPDYLREMPVPFTVIKPVLDRAGDPSDIVFAYANKAAAQLEDLPREALVGKSFYRVYPAASREMLSIIAMTAHTGLKQYFTWINTRKSRYYSVHTYQPWAGYCGCVLQDVTDEAHREAKAKEEHQMLEHLATHDPLTGLLHVRQGRLLIRQSLKTPDHPGERGALFMFDVDNFKQVNDEYGHHQGDAVLEGFARVLERSFRRSDIVFRAGGDEFSAFVPDVPGVGVAERICASVIDGVEELSRKGIPVSVSIGVALGHLEQRVSEDFYYGADEALYHVKRTGKSAFSIKDMDAPLAPDVQPAPDVLADLPDTASTTCTQLYCAEEEAAAC